MTNPDRTLYRTVKLDDLNARAADRPDDYLDVVSSLAVARDDTHVLLTRIAYDALRRKYAAQVIEVVAPTGYDGSALWAELHTAAPLTPELVASIAPRLPCGSCRAEWLAMLDRTPPVYGSLVASRLWVVDRHNETNARLGKPLVTYAQAAARWNW